MGPFNLKGNVKQKDVFRKSILLCFFFCFFENKHILGKTCTIVCSEITFSTSPFHIETSPLLALQINWPFSIWYDFLLKGVSEQTLITAIVIDFRILIVLYDLNGRKPSVQTKGLTSSNAKLFPQNLRYRHKER